MKKVLLFTTIIYSLSVFTDYSMHVDSEEVINELVNEHGFEKTFVINVLKNAKKRKEMLESVANPAEKTKTWDDYKAIFLKKKRIRDGKIFIEDNLLTLQRAEKDFGVPKEVITAILGVETDYGRVMGKYRVIDSLTTLGFDDPRRSNFFRSELIQFLSLPGKIT